MKLGRIIWNKWKEIGRIQDVNSISKPYETGQLFFHRIFGYRGVLLFSWKAKSFDRSLNKQPKDLYSCSKSDKNNPSHKKDEEDNLTKNYFNKFILTDNVENGKEDKLNDEDNGINHDLCYQALVDARDLPSIRSQVETVTFLSKQSRSLYVIPGMDYVNHEDIIPYGMDKLKSEENGNQITNIPIKHDLYPKFLHHQDDGSVIGRRALSAWKDRNYPWLHLSDIYRDETAGVRITVIPFYMGERDSTRWWRYCVRIENFSSTPFIVRERHWRIFSISGTLETVRGKGVIGTEPILDSNQPVFQYSSHVSLEAPSGHMWGTYRMESNVGRSFDVRIPAFNLVSQLETENSQNDGK
ncbi:hypothetical protein SNEBB_004033 [Seison nebaliae]|nr:hypothetical protein SNEBB_004033 [Seison nebaliae]